MASEDAVNSIAAAICSTVALILLVAAGSSCDFVAVESLNEEASGESTMHQASFGVFCQASSGDDKDTLNLEGDSMLLLCRILFSLAIVLGTIGTWFAWGITLWMVPTRGRWLFISIAASVAAVLCVPVFLLFEAEPCDEVGQTCGFSLGAFLLAFSLLFWVSVTIITQCLDPPFGKARSLSDWRMPWTRKSRGSLLQSDTDSYISCIINCPIGKRIKDEDNGGEYVQIERTMLDDSDEEEQLSVNAVAPSNKRRQMSEAEQEVAMGDTASQTLLLGETASQTFVVRREDRTDISLAEQSQATSTPSMEYSIFETTPDPSWMRDSREPVMASLDSTSGGNLIYTQTFVGSAPSPPESLHLIPPAEPEPAVEGKDPTVVLSSALGQSITLESVQEGDEEEESEASEEGSKDPMSPLSRPYQSPPSPPSFSPPPRFQLAEEPSHECIPVIAKLDLPALADEFDNEEDEFDGDKHIETEDRVLDLSEDLGSLEPSVFDVTVTGNESLLDRDNSTHTGRPKRPSPKWKTHSSDGSSISLSQTMHKVLYAPVQVFKGTGKRHERQLKDYKLLDDNDLERSLPMSSPPLEILTIKVSDQAENALSPVVPPTKRERELFNRWIAGNRASRIARRSLALSDTEPDFNITIDDDDDDDDDDRSSGEDALDCSEKDSDQDEKNADPPSRLARHIQRQRLASSVPSDGSSFMSMPISEETTQDLHVSDVEGNISKSGNKPPQPLIRTRSAPNLAAFAQFCDESNKICDDLKMTGVNSYYSAEIFRGIGSSRGSQASRGMDGGKKKDPLSCQLESDEAINTRLHVMATKHNKERPIFRQERALKGAIHRSPSYISDPSSSEDNASLSSRSDKKTEKARNARIRRLQALNQTLAALQPSDDDATPPVNCKNNLLERMKAQYHASAAAAPAYQSDSASECSVEEVSGPVQQGKYNPATRDTSPPRSMKSSNGTVSSFGSGGSFMIDLLDVQLAELYRPDGELKGPDEESL